MRVTKHEVLDEDGVMHVITVSFRTAPIWKFWDDSEHTKQYFGSLVGWYSKEDGSVVKNVTLVNLLSATARKTEIDKVIKKYSKPNLKPVK